MCLDRSRFRARRFHEARVGGISAARRGADDQPFLGCAGLLRMYASSSCVVFAFCQVCHFPRTSLANLQPPLYPQPPSLIHPPLLWQTHHHPQQALQSLTPQSRLSTHFTLASSSLPPLPGVVHGELDPPLCARHRPLGTTRRDFGAASSPMSQHDRGYALLLTLVALSCLF